LAATNINNTKQLNIDWQNHVLNNKFPFLFSIALEKLLKKSEIINVIFYVDGVLFIYLHDNERDIDYQISGSKITGLYLITILNKRYKICSELSSVFASFNWLSYEKT
jgi:hypothetical protein